jgi:nitrite transporter NirC
MYKDTWSAISNAAVAKVNLLGKNPLGFFLASMLAGMFIGFGVLLSFTIGGLLIGQPEQKIIMGVSFGIALSLVIFCGSELFTGNNLIMGAGLMAKKVTVRNAIKLSIICLIGNWLGSILLAVIFHLSGAHTGATVDIFAKVSLAKMTGSFSSLFFKGILCNTLVCLAIWCSFRCKNEVAKLIMIWWCLFAFITCGFEHSIANMTILTIGLLNPNGLALSLGGYMWNIFVVILGNMVGGLLFVAFPYFMIAKEK